MWLAVPNGEILRRAAYGAGDDCTRCGRIAVLIAAAGSTREFPPVMDGLLGSGILFQEDIRKCSRRAQEDAQMQK